ncbi:MAG TPA: glycosyltransferase family 39 protein [Isosphaeraceae bacterium]|nr:glycosyltransferase family 39 protein [Isosphaeraceae bacterium]
MSATPLPPLSAARAWAVHHRRVLEPALIGLLALSLGLAGNGRVSLWDRDEPRYSACVREMRARGDWIFPTFNAEPRYHKPILIYWLMRVGVGLWGDNPYGMRFVSAVAGAGTCLVTWVLGRRIFGPREATLGALMLATAPIVVAESKLATTDATLALWVAGGHLCLWELARRPSRRAAAGFWILLALATLTKGPVGLALIAVSGLVSWWWGGPTACWARLGWRRGLAGFALLVVPWYLAVGLLSHGAFFRFAIGSQVIDRMRSGMEEHGGFPGYYLITTLGTFHPWSALLPAAVLGAWTRRRSRPAFGFLLGWALGPLVLLEGVRTKMVHYYLPAYPACALLAAWLVLAVAREEVTIRRWPLGRLSLGLLGGVAIGATVGLIAAAVVLPAPVRWPCLIIALTIALGTLPALVRFHRAATLPAIARLVATWAVALALAGEWLLPAMEPYRLSRIVGERLAVLTRERKVQPVLLTFQEPSTIYAYGRPVPTIRVWKDFFDQLDRHGAVLAPLLPNELRTIRKMPAFEVEVCDRLTGFNLSKGTTQTLQFTVVRSRRGVAQETRGERPILE